MRLRSFKLRFRDDHVRIVPAELSAACPFTGPGVDLLGEDARRALAEASPIVRLIESMEPDARIRSIAIDLEKPRLLATLDPTVPAADPRPRVVRVESGGLLDRVLDASSSLIPLLCDLASATLSRRGPA